MKKYIKKLKSNMMIAGNGLLCLVIFCPINGAAQSGFYDFCGTGHIEMEQTLLSGFSISNTIKTSHTSNEYMRMLMIFVQFPEETNSVSNWPSGQPPNYMESFIDSLVTSQNVGSLTHYFDEMSLGNFKLVGNSIYIETPHSFDYYYNHSSDETIRRHKLYEDIINRVDSLIDFTPYDNWNGEVFNSNGIVDLIGIVHRSLDDAQKIAFDWTPSIGGIKYLGGGSEIQVDNGSRKVRRGSLNGFLVLNGHAGYEEVKRITIHEIGHFFLGGNNFHIKPGMWGLMAGHKPRGVAINPSERDWLNWIDPNVHEMGEQNKIISLGDYVTTGDVIKVKIPNSSPERFYYLVNHQKESVFDTPDQTGGKGLYILEQPDSVPLSNYPKMHAADGRWNWSVPEKVPNPWGDGELPVFKQEDANPATGYFDINRIPYNWNGMQQDGYIYVYKDPDTNENTWLTRHRGDGKDAFNADGKAYFGPWTNPRPLKPNGDVFSFAFHIENEVNGIMDVKLYLSDYNPGNITVDAVWQGEILLTENVSVSSAATLTILPGTNVRMYPGVSLTIDGTLLAIGTQADPIRFQAGGSSRWNRVSLTGNSSNSDIRWAVFEGGQYGLSAGGTGHQIRNSAFRNNNYGLWLSSVSGTTLMNSVIENNTYEGLLVFDSGHSGNSISYNTITGNGQAGVYLYNSELRDFHGNVIETNNTRGVEVLAGSNLFMQEYLGNPPNDKGLNRVRNNTSHQVYITHSSRAFLGDSWFSTTNAGYNSVFHTSGPGTNRKYIYNLAVTGPGYSGTPYNILAQHSYWDLYPSSGMFHGPVDYTNYLWGSDPTTGSGAGSGQTPQQSIQSGHQSPIVNVLSAGMSGALASSYENPEHAVQALALKQRMMELRDLLASDEWHPHNARRLNELYTLSLLDTGDMLQESGNVEITLTTWADRGSSINSTYRDEEQVKLAIETALLIRVKQALRAGDYARAAALITGASPLIGNADHRMALMKHAISVYAYHGQHEAALDVLGQVRAIEPEKEVAAWYDAPNLRPVEVWLTDASKQKRTGGGAADLLAQVQYQGGTESAVASGGFSLGSNYPNPFNPTTVIPFELPGDSRVKMEVYDLLGRLVTTLSNDMYQAGAHQVVWDARASASGVYLIRAVIEPQQVIYNRRQFTRTVTLLK